MTKKVLLGDDAVALAALHSGINGVFGYPGTPSTEIFEYIAQHRPKDGSVVANWAANEKVGLEEAVGMSFAGRRALVTMKHVGLNVAADPFMNAAITGAHGGLVIAVADDPSMHSSQNEQDSRYFADFGLIPCLEPSNQQEAYDMTREAFELSERLEIPVMVRLVTRLAHSRADVVVRDPCEKNELNPAHDPARWTLLPVNARVGYRKLLDKQPAINAYSESSPFNTLALNDGRLGVIATGIAHNYLQEALADLDLSPEARPSVLHLCVYPAPVEKVRRFVAEIRSRGDGAEILVLEDGYPFIERQLGGLLGLSGVRLRGRLDGSLPRAGELSPDSALRALRGEIQPPPLPSALPPRPPALCKGCPHGDTYTALSAALKESGATAGAVFSDIGCYTLGAYPPYEAIDTCLDMGASVSMAAGAADGGLHPSLAVLGDSTFMHSGMTPLVGAAKRNCPITVIIVDNGTVAMTGRQDTMATGDALENVVLGLGVAREHVRVLKPLPKAHDEMVRVLREEIAYQGTSVILARRPCIHVR